MINVFKKGVFLGTFKTSELTGSRNVLGAGSIINIAKKKYVVNNIMVRKDETIVAEVSN